MNKAIAFFILLALFQTAYSQDKNVEITLETDSVIYTSWIELNAFPFLKRPYVIIDNPNGLKINLRDLKAYHGVDQKGTYKKLFLIDHAYYKECYFTEIQFRNDSSGKVEVHYNQLTFGQRDDFDIRKYTNYRIQEGPIKKLSYANVKSEFNKINITNEPLGKANKIRIIQFISLGIGLAIMTDVLIENFNPHDKRFMDKSSKLKFVVGGLFMTFPLSLEKTKEKRLLKAMQSM